MGLPIYLIPRVRVEWIDCVSDSGWATDKELHKMKLARPVNEGWLYSKDNKSVKLFASYDKDDNEITFGGSDDDSSGLGKEDSEVVDGVTSIICA